SGDAAHHGRLAPGAVDLTPRAADRGLPALPACQAMQVRLLRWHCRPSRGGLMCSRFLRLETRRRGILRAGLLVLSALVLPLVLPGGALEIGGHSMQPPSASAQSDEDNPIVRENRLPGDNQWQRVGSRRHGDQTVSEAETSNTELWQPSAIMG